MRSRQTKRSTPPKRAAEVTKPKEEAAKPKKLDRGVATEMWLELLAHPKNSKRSLWLLVGGRWFRWDNPPPQAEASVQSAFCNCPERLEVLVWYYKSYDDEPEPSGNRPANTDPEGAEKYAKYDKDIQGLVVRSK